MPKEQQNAASDIINESQLVSVDRLLAILAMTHGTRRYRLVRDELLLLDRDLVIGPLIASLNKAGSNRSFDRLARLLAQFGGEEAVQTLAWHTRTQERYPRLAMRALARCDHPLVIPTLLDLLEYGRRRKQRRSAARYLARVGRWRAIEPLCRAAAMGENDNGPDAKEALRGMGRADHIARLLFEDGEATNQERVTALEAMARVIWFNPERFLDKESRRWLSPWKAEARETAELLRARKTLLRPAESADIGTLLRSAGSPVTGDTDSLLRVAADMDVIELHVPAAAEPRWWQRAAGLLGLVFR